VDDFFRFLSDGANRKTLLLDTLNTLVTRCDSLLNADASHFIAVCASLHKRFVHIEAHLVDKFSSFNVIESVDHQVKLLKESKAKPFFLDLTQVCFN